ncbi:MAG: hypothetical protein EOO55_04160 [Hymenobacter sp.]|nr:MAG: hypothetical protein EOO55_04160 [Hymenobacter sp.]
MKQLLLCLILLSLGSCKKDDPDALPAATQVGANMGGYLLDGLAVRATGRPGYNGLLSSVNSIAPVAGEFLNDSMLCVQLCSIQNEQRYRLTLFVRYHGLGVYQFHEITPQFGGASLSALRNHAFLYQDCSSYGCAVKSYITDSLHTGTLTITYINGSPGIVAGLFEFMAYDAYNKEIIKVSSGRFDLSE